jgi:hypothetical protein
VGRSLVVCGPKLMVEFCESVEREERCKVLVSASMRWRDDDDENDPVPHAPDVLAYLVRTYI